MPKYRPRAAARGGEGAVAPGHGMNAASRRPGFPTQHTISVTLRLTDHGGDYGSITLPAAVSVLWGYAADRIGADHYDPGAPDEVSFVQLPQPIAPLSLASALANAVRSYVADNGEQCVAAVIATAIDRAISSAG